MPKQWEYFMDKPIKVIAIGGEPGAGKSTLMRKLIAKHNIEGFYDDVYLVPYHHRYNLYVLGKYEDGEVFAGTDRMSMAVQPEAMKFLKKRVYPDIVLFEGDRLFNQSFLEHCNNNYELHVIYLKTSKDIRKKRYEERGSNQDPTWLAGRETKVNNILNNLELKFVTEIWANNNETELELACDYISSVIRE